MHSKRHIFSLILINHGQNVYLDNVFDKFEIGSSFVKKKAMVMLVNSISIYPIIFLKGFFFFKTEMYIMDNSLCHCVFKDGMLQYTKHCLYKIGSLKFSESTAIIIRVGCYGRPLLQAWLLPNLNAIPYNCIGKNSL